MVEAWTSTSIKDLEEVSKAKETLAEEAVSRQEEDLAGEEAPLKNNTIRVTSQRIKVITAHLAPTTAVVIRIATAIPMKHISIINIKEIMIIINSDKQQGTLKPLWPSSCLNQHIQRNQSS